MSGGKERREFPRSKSSIPVAGGDDVLEHVDNISGSGVLCHTKKPVALMTKMSIVLELPGEGDDGRVQCEGVVVRCDPDPKKGDSYEVAILYTYVEADDRARIETFVEKDIADALSDDEDDD